MKIHVSVCQNAMSLHKVRVNGINWTEGKKFVRVSEVFELSEFELSGVNYYKKYCQIQGELDLVQVNEEFELSASSSLRGITVLHEFYINSYSTEDDMYNTCRNV